MPVLALCGMYVGQYVHVYISLWYVCVIAYDLYIYFVIFVN